ncbi:MAG: hypothetical protein PVG32_05015 [Anaerolineales bacterium]|jgi:ABC-type transporter Mla subunit MlaD
MNSIRKIFGAALLIVSLLGLLLSVVGLYFVPRAVQQAGNQIADTLELVILTLEATSESLTLANTSLDQAVDALHAVNTTTQGVGETLDETGPLVDSLAVVVGGDLPQVITTTQQSLISAQESALVIDQVLYGLNSVSFLTGVNYDPETPLSESLVNVSESLEGMPQSFVTIQDNLEKAQTSLETVESGVGELSDSLSDVETSLDDAKDVIDKYVQVVSEVKSDLTETSEKLPRWTRIGVWIAYFSLVWLAVIQVGLIFQGREMLAQRELNNS